MCAGGSQGHRWVMRYILTTQSGATLDDFNKVAAAIGAEPPTGMLARYVGTNEIGVCITTIWASKADSDRFTVERLFPALRQVFGREPGEPTAAVGYEAVDELVIETTP
jgi:hypothetical protein